MVPRPARDDSDSVDDVTDRLGSLSMWAPSSKEEEKLVEEMTVLDEEYLNKKQEFDQKLAELKKGYRNQWRELLSKRTELLQASKATPNFWAQVLKNEDATGELIEEWDEPVLNHLKDLKYEWLTKEDVDGFRLVWEFEENPFFENTTIVKTYHTESLNRFSDDLEVTKIEVDEIKWKAGQNVTVEMVQKKKKQGRKGKPKMVSVEEKRQSFFRHFFRTITPDMEISEFGSDSEEEESDDEEYNKTEMIMDDDFETGCILRDSVIPHAVRWYTGEACDGSEDDSMPDEDSDEEGDSDEDSDDDSPVATKNGKGGEECKQQ